MLRSFTTTSAVLAVLCASAHAEPRSFEPAVTLGAAGMYGINSEDSELGNGVFGMLQLGYMHSTGTEIVLSGGLLSGADKEASYLAYAGTLRQRLRAGQVQPFLEAGFHHLLVNSDGALTPQFGAGVEWRIPKDTGKGTFGIAGGMFVADGTSQHDWYVRFQLARHFRF